MQLHKLCFSRQYWWAGNTIIIHETNSVVDCTSSLAMPQGYMVVLPVWQCPRGILLGTVQVCRFSYSCCSNEECMSCSVGWFICSLERYELRVEVL